MGFPTVGLRLPHLTWLNVMPMASNAGIVMKSSPVQTVSTGLSTLATHPFAQWLTALQNTPMIPLLLARLTQLTTVLACTCTSAQFKRVMMPGYLGSLPLMTQYLAVTKTQGIWNTGKLAVWDLQSLALQLVKHHSWIMLLAKEQPPTWEILKLSRLALTLASSKIWMVALIHVLLHMECWSQVRSQKLLPLITLELVPKKQLTSQLEACAHNKHCAILLIYDLLYNYEYNVYV